MILQSSQFSTATAPRMRTLISHNITINSPNKPHLKSLKLDAQKRNSDENKRRKSYFFIKYHVSSFRRFVGLKIAIFHCKIS